MNKTTLTTIVTKQAQVLMTFSLSGIQNLGHSEVMIFRITDIQYKQNSV